MRYLLTMCLLAVFPLAVRAQDKKEIEVVPIKELDLKRSDPVSYEREIEPIFQKRCIVCHSSNKDAKKGKLDLSSYNALIKGGGRGEAVIPGKGDQSLLYKSMRRTARPYMPPPEEPVKPATPEEVALVKLWIDQGARAPKNPALVSGIRPRPVPVPPPANVTPVRALALSPDKSAVASGRGNRIHIYDAGSGAHIRELIDPKLMSDGKPVKAAHISIVEAMTFSPDGKYLVSGGFEEIAIWDVKTGMQHHKITGFAYAVVAVAFSSDGKYLITGGGAPTEDGEVKVFDVNDKWKLITDIKNGHSDTVYGVSISPDNKKIATCSADKFIKIWELPSGKFIKSLEGHTHHVLDIGWSSDGKTLASAGADNIVKVWDYEKGEKVRDINAHAKQVTRLIFFGKANQFCTCGGDAQVKFFNTGGGTIRNFGQNNDFVYAIGVSPDGAVVAAGGQEGVVRVYNGTNGTLTRTLLPPDAQQQAPPKK